MIKKLQDCCREVRLGAVPCKHGDIRDGWNTITDQYEQWQVVKVDHQDNWNSLMKLIFASSQEGCTNRGNP